MANHYGGERPVTRDIRALGKSGETHSITFSKRPSSSGCPLKGARLWGGCRGCLDKCSAQVPCRMQPPACCIGVQCNTGSAACAMVSDAVLGPGCLETCQIRRGFACFLQNCLDSFEIVKMADLLRSIQR